MSASTEKKRRQATRESGNGTKIETAKKEAAKKARRKLWWILGVAGFAVLLAVLLFFTSNTFKDSTTALTINDRDYSPAEVNFQYSSQFYYFSNQYGSFASFLGLDTSYGLSGLSSQLCSYTDDGTGTWRDYFIGTAKKEMARNQALYDYAVANGITLNEEELATIEDSITEIEAYTALNDADIEYYLSQAYGRGVTVDIIRQASIESTLADKAVSEYSSSLEYTDEELEEYYASLNGEKDYFDYIYYYVKAEEVETVGEDGESTEAPTEETLAKAKATADAIIEEYEKASSASVEDRLNDALAKIIGSDAEISTRSATVGSDVDVGETARIWMTEDGRKSGDITAIDNDSKGYFVVSFLSRDNNDYNTKQARHILIAAEISEDGTYSEEAKATAKARAEEILAEWEAGEKTEESFAELAKLYSDDSDSSSNGGLYDAVIRDQMVEGFNDFCYDESRKSGDTAIVYGESSLYAGYHIMYYVGEGDLCRHALAYNDLISIDTDAWAAEQQVGYEAKERFGLRFVG